MRPKFVVGLLFTLCLALLCACGTTPSNAPEGSSAKEAAKAVASAVKPINIPEGTVISVSLGETLGSKTSHAGDKFTGTVAAPVEVDGKAVIPVGAAVSGTVTDAKAAGRFKGGALLALRLDSVTIKGREHAVKTSMVSEASKGKGKRSAAMIGGGAGGGAVIGALAGGGKGAAIGAAVGAAAGTAGAGLTGNRDITLPVETKLSFKLLEPLEVK